MQFEFIDVVSDRLKKLDTGIIVIKYIKMSLIFCTQVMLFTMYEYMLS